MRFEYLLNRSEFIEARLENKCKYKPYRDKLIFVFLSCAIAFFVFLKFVMKESTLLLIISISMGCLITKILLKKVDRKSIESSSTSNEYKISLELKGDKLLVSKNDCKIEIECKSILYIVETKKYIHIYTSIQEEIFLSKKVFKTDIDKQAFLDKFGDYCEINKKKKNH